MYKAMIVLVLLAYGLTHFVELPRPAETKLAPPTRDPEPEKKATTALPRFGPPPEYRAVTFRGLWGGPRNYLFAGMGVDVVGLQASGEGPQAIQLLENVQVQATCTLADPGQTDGLISLTFAIPQEQLDQLKYTWEMMTLNVVFLPAESGRAKDKSPAKIVNQELTEGFRPVTLQVLWCGPLPHGPSASERVDVIYFGTAKEGPRRVLENVKAMPVGRLRGAEGLDRMGPVTAIITPDQFDLLAATKMEGVAVMLPTDYSIDQAKR